MMPKLGTGTRFSNLKQQLSQNPKVKNPGALSAWLGMKRLGKTKFEQLAHNPAQRPGGKTSY